MKKLITAVAALVALLAAMAAIAENQVPILEIGEGGRRLRFRWHRHRQLPGGSYSPVPARPRGRYGCA